MSLLDAIPCSRSATHRRQMSLSGRYEIAYYEDMADDIRIQTLTSCINSERFKSNLIKTGGYDTSYTGQIRKVQHNQI